MLNLLDILTHLDPSIPTYLGTLIPHRHSKISFMAGGFYGFSYGVVKTLAAADLDDDTLCKSYFEDGRMGEFVVSPLLPRQGRMHPYSPPRTLFQISLSPVLPRINIPYRSPIPTMSLRDSSLSFYTLSERSRSIRSCPCSTPLPASLDGCTGRTSPRQTLGAGSSASRSAASTANTLSPSCIRPA